MENSLPVFPTVKCYLTCMGYSTSSYLPRKKNMSIKNLSMSGQSSFFHSNLKLETNQMSNG